MTGVEALRLVPADVDGEESTANGQNLGDDRAFLAALAAVLHETTARFEETASQITDIVTTRRDPADRDLIMALQDFDRLQQEFSALGGALARFAETIDGVQPNDEKRAWHEGDAVSAISVSDLRERLVRRLQGVAAISAERSVFDEEIF